MCTLSLSQSLHTLAQKCICMYVCICILYVRVRVYIHIIVEPVYRDLCFITFMFPVNSKSNRILYVRKLNIHGKSKHLSNKANLNLGKQTFYSKLQ